MDLFKEFKVNSFSYFLLLFLSFFCLPSHIPSFLYSLKVAFIIVRNRYCIAKKKLNGTGTYGIRINKEDSQRGEDVSKGKKWGGEN